MKRSTFRIFFAILLLLPISAQVDAAGTYLSSGGPINQSMGGASTAAPLDAIGALYWNPATTSAVPNELGFGIGVLTPDLETSSSIPGLAAGTSDAEPGATPLPTVGWVFRPEHSAITYGLGVHAIAGYKTNFAASTTNPLFTPQSNAPGFPGGLGRVFTGAEFMQIAPTVSLAVSDRFSIAAGPTVTLGQLFADPLLLTSPDDADGSGVPRYPSGRGTRSHWGGGFQVGVYYITDRHWHFGASLKSPQWMETIHFRTEDELGRPRVGRTKLDLPMILSLGTAYSGYRDWVFAMDARYYDFKNTDGWGAHGFNLDGSLGGVGQSNLLEIALGAQYQFSETLFLRTGYTFNQNPYQDAEATYAALAPLFYQHQLHFGGSKYLAENVALNVAYSYWPENTVAGPLVTPLGPVPGGRVSSTLSVHHVNAGITVRY
jgi:long-chain fatty acid transport protein